MQYQSRREILISLFAVASFVGAACAPATQPSPESKPSTSSAPPSKPADAPATAAPAKAAPSAPQKVNVRLPFLADGLGAFFGLAQEKGYYAEEGLDVSILEGKGGNITMQSVVAGNDHFGAIPVDVLFKGVSQGMPLKIVASLYEKSGMGIVCHKDANVLKPKDLEGKTLAVTAGEAGLTLLPILLRLNNADASKVTQLSVDAPSKTTTFLAKKTDCAMSWFNSSYIPIRRAADVTFFTYADNGLNSLGDHLITREDVIEKSPQMVRGFTRATMKGLRSTIANPDEAAAAMVKAFPNLKLDIVQEQVKNSLPLFESDATKQNGLGYQDKTAYEKLQEFLLQAGMLDKKIDVSKAYTNDFLK